MPGFNDGMISIQNSASQLVVPAMDIQPGHRVLDACAAPGGKMIHMLETQPDLYELVAVDISETRCSEIVDNLERVGKSATVMTTDAGQTRSVVGSKTIRPYSFGRTLYSNGRHKQAPRYQTPQTPGGH